MRAATSSAPVAGADCAFTQQASKTVKASARIDALLERVIIAAIVAESTLAACRDFVCEFVTAIPARENSGGAVSASQGTVEESKCPRQRGAGFQACASKRKRAGGAAGRWVPWVGRADRGRRSRSISWEGRRSGRKTSEVPTRRNAR